MTRDPELLKYYGRRAAEYDRIYAPPERQPDLAELVRTVTEEVAGRAVLEIACGTGWWTEKLATTAARVVATDAAPEVLERARARIDGRPGAGAAAPGAAGAPAEFRLADAFSPESVAGDFNALVAGFWLSHVTRGGVAPFLRAWERRLGPGGRVLLFDNRFVAGKSTPVSRREDSGDTYQIRRLDDGGEYEVLKNFYDAADLAAAVPCGAEPRLRDEGFYWFLAYDIPGAVR